MSEIKEVKEKEKDPCKDFPLAVKTGPEICGYCGEPYNIVAYWGGPNYIPPKHKSPQDCFLLLKSRIDDRDKRFKEALDRIAVLENKKKKWFER
jgi:hypothetical protein